MLLKLEMEVLKCFYIIIVTYLFYYKAGVVLDDVIAVWAGTEIGYK